MNSICLKKMHELFPKEEDLVPSSGLVEGLQMVRGFLQRDGGVACSILATAEPLAKCSSSGTFDRQDLTCELLTWLWEERGEGHETEFHDNNCAFEASDRFAGGDEHGPGGYEEHSLLGRNEL